MRAKAFTLVELLVVIAIIAVLMAVLLPSLQKAKAEAKTLTCASMERQVGVMMLMFHSDHLYLPFCSWNNPRFSWVNMMMGSEEALYEIADDGSGDTDFCPDEWNSINYLGDARKLVWCTESTPTSRLGDHWAGYAASSTGLRLEGPRSNQLAILSRAKLQTYRRQSHNAMLACSKSIAFADHFNAYASSDGVGRINAGHPGMTTNFLYQDGHIERHVPAFDSMDRLDPARKTMAAIGYTDWE